MRKKVAYKLKDCFNKNADLLVNVSVRESCFSQLKYSTAFLIRSVSAIVIQNSSTVTRTIMNFQIRFFKGNIMTEIWISPLSSIKFGVNSKSMTRKMVFENETWLFNDLPRLILSMCLIYLLRPVVVLSLINQMLHFKGKSARIIVKNGFSLFFYTLKINSKF